MRLLPYLMENTGVCEEEEEEECYWGETRGKADDSGCVRWGRDRFLFIFFYFFLRVLRLSSCVRGGG